MFPIILKMSYELFAKLATEVFGDAKMEAYYQAWKLSKSPVTHEDLVQLCSLAMSNIMNPPTNVACSLARSDTYADHEYGGGSLAHSDTYAGCSLARSEDHEYGGGSLARANPMDQNSDDHPMDGSNAKPNPEEDEDTEMYE